MGGGISRHLRVVLGYSGWNTLFQLYCRVAAMRPPYAGLHLEIDPRGSEMTIYEKEGG